jgi:CheY-like chemotaxis protein
MADRIDPAGKDPSQSATARLLVVDDNADILEMLTVLLSEKYCVSGCASAAEALKALETSRPDILMLDIRMSPVDGLQCLEAIRANPRYAQTPAIALTAFAGDAERQAFLAGGFQAVVAKPILDPAELETLIDGLLDSSCSVAP